MIIYHVLFIYIIIGACLTFYSLHHGSDDLDKIRKSIKDYGKIRKFYIAFVLCFCTLLTSPINMLSAIVVWKAL